MNDIQLDEWISKLLDDSISDEETRSLKQALKKDDAALAYYLDVIEIHELLLESSQDGKTAWLSELPSQKSSRRPYILTFVAGIAAILAFVLIPRTLREKSNQSHATVTKIDESEERFQVGALLKQNQTIHLKSSRLAFAMASGVDVEVQGPASFQVLDKNSLSLVNGQLAAYVPPEATGFRVVTPNGDVVDHGTDIGVSVNKDATELHVFDGKAEILLPSENVTTMVAGGEAVRMYNQNNAGYEPIPIAPESSFIIEATKKNRIEFNFDQEGLQWTITQSGDFNDRGDRPPSLLTQGENRLDLVTGFVSLPTEPDTPGLFMGPHRFAPQDGKGRILPLPFHMRDSMNSVRLSSPPFRLDLESGSITAYLTGGRGQAKNPPNYVADLASEASDEGFMGLALRRVKDGRFVCSIRRSPGNFYEWSQVEISSRILADAVKEDSADEVYVLDLIDTYRNPHWGWIGLDSVSVPGFLVTP